jgi:secreted trypsin-like serine protease
VRIDLNGKFLCGGTLISREFILTAAHCNDFSDRGTMTVTLGTDTRTGTGKIQFAVADKILHPKYKVGNPDIYDVLLLRLKVTVLDDAVLDDYVKNIPRLDDGISNENKDAFNVIGLGHESIFGTYTYANTNKLQVATVNRVDQTECKQKFGNKLSADMLCAHAIGKDACQGDSGGPLVIIPNTSSHPSDHILVGLTSWGVGCAHEKYPGVYARVSHVLGWINNEQICQQELMSTYGANTGPKEFCINPQGIAQSRRPVTRVRQSRTRRSRRKRRNRRRKRRSAELHCCARS